MYHTYKYGSEGESETTNIKMQKPRFLIEIGVFCNRYKKDYALFSSFFSSRGGLGISAFLDTFSFLVFGSNPKYFTWNTSPILTTSETFSVRSQANSDT